MKKLSSILLTAGLLVSGLVQALEPALPAVKADLTQLGVSGLSSGAAMAGQLGVAHSDRFAAVGIMAGPPYLCANNASSTAVVSCLIMPVEWSGFTIPSFLMGPRDRVDVNALISATRYLATESPDDPNKGIASTANIANQRVWVSRGSKDVIVGPNATQAVRDFYTAFSAKLAPVETPAVPHTLPTDKPNLGPCDGEHKDANYVSSCDLDEAGKMLSYLYNWPAGTKRTVAKAENLRTFDQGHYTVDGKGTRKQPSALSMADQARVYVPSGCENGQCKVHVAIHGCQQGKDTPYDLFTRVGGYNEWAEANKLIVLYPRVLATTKVFKGEPVNPRGCWDWWGYVSESQTGWRFYAKRNGSQIRSIMNMVEALGK